MNYGPRFIHAFLQDLINVADEASPPPFYARHNINRPVQALDMLHQLLQCLGIIHSERLCYIHANISPNNLGWVLNDDNGELNMRPRWCLIDFTGPKLVSSYQEVVRTLVLTPGYGAPETDLGMTKDFLSENPRYKPCEGYRYYPLVCMKSDVYAVARVVEETYPELKCGDPTGRTENEQKMVRMLQKVIRRMKSVNLEERLSTKDALVRIENIKELAMPMSGETPTQVDTRVEWRTLYVQRATLFTLVHPIHYQIRIQTTADMDAVPKTDTYSDALDEKERNRRPLYIIEWPRLTTGYGCPKLPRAINPSEDKFRPQHFDSSGAFELLLTLASEYKVKPIDVIIDERDNYIVSVTSTTKLEDNDYYFAGKRVLVFKQEFRYMTPVLERIVEKACDSDLRAIAKVHRIHVQRPKYAPRTVLVRTHVYLQDLIHLPEERSPFYEHHGMSWVLAAYDMLYQLLRCLVTIHHKLGLVHGNISNSNVGWVASGDDIRAIRPRWCLIDFTDSKWIKNVDNKLYFRKYTAEYAAPETLPDYLELFAKENPGVLEQTAGGEYIPMVCAKSDVFAVAAVVMDSFPIFECERSDVNSDEEMDFVSGMQYCLSCMLSTRLKARYTVREALKMVRNLGGYYLNKVGLDKLQEHKKSD
ncbi:hypothetical protein GQ42DRAFT_169891 [Ramicandelaber brevisporus]|nr:hypothetical protein GQ42DRAFT_169891 [Ramicandelaber brevisporus]